jgi:hypothetical protein
MKRILSIGIALFAFGALQAQTPLITDGLMMPAGDLGTGVYYGRDQWNHYWEGSLKRENGNIGTVTTQSAAFMGAFGVSDRVSLVVLLPYVWTEASGGTLHGMQGLQDVSFTAKYNFFKADIGKSNIKFFVVGTFSTPASDYNKDLLPLSIGLGSTNLSGRLTAAYSYNQSWYATASAAYTGRSNIELDRPSYYTNGRLYYTNEVEMPSQFDFIARAGYKKDFWHAELYYTQLNTLGGGDIRRQDAPFASNRMNASKVGASLMWSSPKLSNIALRAWGNYAVAGRNVGQSTSVMAGVMYFFHFSKNK